MRQLHRLMNFGIARKLSGVLPAPVSDMPVRVRFAPSPTGFLHLGGLRTALYNYLFARSQNGSFILRIEDTDQTRLIPGAVEALIDTLQWAGIAFDEGPVQGGLFGPYVQSARLSIYKENVQRLLENGTAYRCFCTSKRLDLLRKEALSRGEIPKYDNRCRSLNAGDVRSRLENGEKYVVRFKLEHYKEPWHDIVFGPIVYDVASIEGDPILMKSDGYPTYHFANVVDDHFMGITHVLRGVEWQVSTTKHVLLYRAFGWRPPLFAHLPLLMNKDGKKLSKRQNDAHVEQYKKLGYFPEALLNLLTNAGSGFKVRETAGMVMNELISHFDLTKLNTNSTRVDFDRMGEFNRLHFQRQLKDSRSRSKLICDIRQLIECHATEHKMNVDSITDERVSRLLDLSEDRICLLTDLLRPEFQYAWVAPNTASVDKFPGDPYEAANIITQTAEALSALDIDHFDRAHLLTHTGCVVQRSGWTNARYMKLLRHSLGLPSTGPPVIDIIVVLGKDAILTRLRDVLTSCSRRNVHCT